MDNRAWPAAARSHHQRFDRSTGRRLIRLLIAVVALAAAAGCTLPTSGGEATLQISGAPLVRIAAPQANATFLEGVEVFVQAAVTNAGPDISRVEVSVDRTVIATLQSPNQAGGAVFTITQAWTAAEAGPHVIEVVAFRADGSSSAPAAVTINVVSEADRATDTPEDGDPDEAGSDSDSAGSGSGASRPQATAAPTETPAPTEPPAPTEVPATPTPDVPTASINPNNSGGVNVRTGPDLAFPALGTLTSGTEVELLAFSTREDWLKVRFNGTTEGWILGQLATIRGETSTLPREAGPPLPATPIPTAIPATAAPTALPSSVNLVFATNITLNPNPATCGVNFTVTITIRNDGTTQSGTGTILAEDVHRTTGGVQATSSGTLLLPPGGLAPGQTHTVTWTAQVATFYNEDHFIRVKIDPNNQIAETNEGDNEQQIPYVLARGGC